MTPKAQQIAIAKAVGWTFHDVKVAPKGGDVFEKLWLRPGVDIAELNADQIAYGGGYFLPPDYHSSRDAIQAALDTLTTLGQWLQFRFHLSRIVLGLRAERDGYVPNHRRDDGTKHWFDCVHATAPQLAEAFLRTLNLYEDSDT